MAQDSNLTTHDNIWHFTVSDPQLHRKGYTVYKVTCQTFPIKSPESLIEVVCWKRYNDFKTLYKSLTALHKALHRRDQFPEFAKPKLFGRFDETVIEERRLSAVELLNFVATQPHLYKSLIFRNFLEDGKAKGGGDKKGIMVPKQTTLDILSNATQPDNNPPPDLLKSLNQSGRTHRELLQVSGSSQPAEMSVSGEEMHAGNNGNNGLGGAHVQSNSSNDLATLDGTWNYPQVADTISLSSSTGDETADTDEDSNLGSSLPDAELAFFDPVAHESSVSSGTDQPGNLPHSNSWLLAGLNFCAELEEGKEQELGDDELDSAITPNAHELLERKETGHTESTLTNDSSSSYRGSLSSDLGLDDRTVGNRGSEIEEFDPLRKMSVMSSDSSKVECGKGDLDLSGEWQPRSGTFTSQSSSGSVRGPLQPATTGKLTSTSSSSRSQSLGSEKSEETDRSQSNSSTPTRGSRSLLKKLVSGSPRRPRTMTAESITGMDLGGKEDYIYLAASQICMAQNSEANGDYEVAFAYYKSGVGILLQGVQSDTNKGRRDAVRRKTAQYLMKAEDLFNRHLASEKVDERRWGADSYLSPSLDLDPSFTFIRGTVKDLRNFQVLGLLDKVILVRDKETDETYVVKSILKSAPDTGRTQTILPTSCPHMVSLHKFFETDNTVFLLLQYASGGRLWNYIGDYLNRDRTAQADGGVELGVRTDTKNIYSGSKVESCFESKQDAPISKETREVLEEVNIEAKLLEGIHKTDNRTVEISEDSGVFRYSDLRKDSDATIRQTLSTGPDSETKDVVGKDIQTSTPHKPELDRRLSSLSDDCSQVHESDSCVISPTTLLEEEENQFHLLLRENRGNLEDFSINSFDSEDQYRHSSSYSERIGSIPEDTEFDDVVEKPPASRQISADEVFCSSRKEDSKALTPGVKVRPSSTDGVFPSDEAKRFAASFKADDIVESSKQLLRQVERVLSETDDRGLESSGAHSQSSQNSNSISKENSNNSNSSNEEVSIYDMDRSSEDESSNGYSEKTEDSPTTDNSEGNNFDTDPNLLESSKDTSAIIPHREADPARKTDLDGKPKVNLNSSTSLFHRQNSGPAKLSHGRLDSKDMTRSASFECDLKSPTRNRARTVSDLFDRLDATNTEQVRLPESSIRKWIAHLITAVSRLHSLGIICRDLKPNNVLLGDGGNVYLTYFCHLGHGDQTLDWEAVEDLYAAPEVASINSYDRSCDWWSIGALFYELVVGRSLKDCHPGGINSHTYLHVPAFVSSEARSLLEGLLTFNPRERLGSGIAGAEEIKAHPFFAGIDWHSLEYSSY